MVNLLFLNLKYLAAASFMAAFFLTLIYGAISHANPAKTLGKYYDEMTLAEAK